VVHIVASSQVYENPLKIRMKNLFYLVVFLLIANFAYAQKYSVRSKKAIKHFETALTAYHQYKTELAEEEIRNALNRAPDFIEAHLLQAEINLDKNDYQAAIGSYASVLQIDTGFFPLAYYNKGEIELKIGMYSEAKQDFEKFAMFKEQSERYTGEIRRKLQQCEFGIKAVNNPVPFDPQNLGENINSEFYDYWPSLTADEQTLIFTVLLPIDKTRPPSADNFQEDFFISRKQNGIWLPARNLGKPMNTGDNEGAQAISADGSFMAFTACNRINGFGRCDIYYSTREDNEWQPPQNIGAPINTAYWESQPTLSATGRIMYFVSNRPGGKGGMDIWQSEFTDKGTWSAPVNLGDSINTPFDETSPFIHFDDQTLYFSSTGWIGLGNRDLYMTRKKDSTNWATPVNLGYPINTYADESGMIVTIQGDRAIYSSDREGGYGELDLYEFIIPETIRPVETTYVKGIVSDSQTKQKLEAHYELIDLQTERTVIQSLTDKKTGEFLVCLPRNKNFALNVSKTGYLFHSENFSLLDLIQEAVGLKPYIIPVELQAVNMGQKMILKNVFFETASYELKPESNTELNKLVAFMNNNPSLNIEIGGHTDNEGTRDYNKNLSLNRAKAVLDYLVAHGIMENRLSFAGYGLDQPISTNDTAEGRASNRRTEIKIIE